MRMFIIVVFQVCTPDHIRYNRLLCTFLYHFFGNLTPVTKNRNSFTHFKEFFHSVCNIDQSHAFFFQLPDLQKQCVDLMFRKRRCGLVKNHNL